MAIAWPTLSHPIRLSLLVFAGLATLVIAGAFFVHTVHPLRYLAFGLPYALFLAVFGVGLALAGTGRLVQLWLIGGPCAVFGTVGLLWWAQSAPEHFFAWLQAVLATMLVILGLYIAAGCGIAISGWVKFVRGNQAINRA
jgi:hypothetical protein